MDSTLFPSELRRLPSRNRQEASPRPSTGMAGSTATGVDVTLPSPLRARAMPFSDRVRIVETDEPSAVRRMPRQQMHEALRPSRRHFRSPYDELDPVSYLVEGRVWP